MVSVGAPLLRLQTQRPFQRDPACQLQGGGVEIRAAVFDQQCMNNTDLHFLLRIYWHHRTRRQQSL